MPSQPTLPEGYAFRDLTPEQFNEIFDQKRPEVFGDDPVVFLPDVISAEEMSRARELRFKERPWQVIVGIYHQEECIGWHIGDQINLEMFYMRNSAIMPAHRRQGLYAALMAHVVDRIVEKGFQTIISHHTLTNNPIIIAKLKYGFRIAGVETTDTFGTCVKLVYYPNENRQKLFRYRVGAAREDDDIKRWTAPRD